MKQFNLRMDEDTLDTIRRLSEERGIDATRYARMLIEKGLVIDHQLHQQHPQDNVVKMNRSATELLIENTLVLKAIYRSLFKDEQAYYESMADIKHKTKALLDEMT